MSNQHAIVLGGSMAGLLAARVLSDTFERVSIVERDRFPQAPDNRKGVPQARHAHALLARGYDVLRALFPGIEQDLAQGGALIGDPSEITHWFQLGHYSARRSSGLAASYQSRAFLEYTIRRRVLALPNVKAYPQTEVLSLLANEDRSRVTGVTLRLLGTEAPEVRLEGDLVVDASGRGSQAPKWLRALGYAEPAEANIKVDFAYVSRIYRCDPAALSGYGALFILPKAPHEKRGGAIFPIEGDRWLVTLGGFVGDHPPLDEPGFLEFARTLPSPDLYNVIKNAEPLSELVQHKFPSSRRRYYEKLSRFPDGLVVMGDAVCSFNPIYGQGMTVAAVEATTLAAVVKDRRSGMPMRFFKAIAKFVDVPWSLAAGGDFRYPQVSGPKQPFTDWLNRYSDRMGRVAAYDDAVWRAFIRVVNLVEPPGTLFAPKIVARVLFAKPPRANPNATAMQMKPRQTA